MKLNRIIVCLTASVLLTACFRSKDKTEERDKAPAAADASTRLTDRRGSVGDTENNIDGDDIISYDSGVIEPGNADSQIPEADSNIAEQVPQDIPGESIRQDTNPLEGVEICLESTRASWASADWDTTTDSEGNYTIDTSNAIIGSSYALTPRKPGYVFEPDSTVLSYIGSVVTGNVEDDFVITKIDTGPHATGQWKLVEYNPSTETPCQTLPLIVVPAGMYDNFFANCNKEIDTIYTFKDGCLLGEMSINCVDNMQYTAGSGRCSTEAVYSWSEYNGHFDEDTHRWVLTENAMIVVPGQGMGGMGGYVTQAYSADLVLQQVSSSVSTP